MIGTAISRASHSIAILTVLSLPYLAGQPTPERTTGSWFLECVSAQIHQVGGGRDGGGLVRTHRPHWRPARSSRSRLSWPSRPLGVPWSRTLVFP